ncbi:purine and uridine phosphorylase [Aspergillus pseudoustus]|uniref:Purine and uridine phosphorylase n=1 Tax=Aspergillus pseudoustus TaxID=1810923 RepID=A0ABR4J245_9EURO
MLTHEDYAVGWISALPLEMRAARAVLEEMHPHLPQRPTDSNSYILGAIGGHNVVIVCLPYGIYGTTSAASVLTNMMASFPNLEFALMVGIGGGVPGTAVDVRLGDLVVSKPTGTYGGVVQYDYGKVVSGRGFQQTGALNQPPQVLLTSIAQLQADQLATTTQENPLCDILSRAFEKSPELKRGFASPGRDRDQLFAASYRHVESQETCDMCDKDQIVLRSERDPSFKEPKVHYGLIASGNQVMKDAEIRDQLAKKFDIICFEMEAAGLMNQIPASLLENKIWQGYAALTAAAYAKLLLSVVPVHSPSRAEKKKDLSAEEKACLRALVLTDPADDLNALKRRRGERVPGTCNWIIVMDEVRQWLGLLPETSKANPKTVTAADILWIFGNPGTGKSTVATAMAEELPKQPSFQRNKSNRTLAYFFCGSTIEERRTATAILRGLLYQLIQQRQELIRFVHSKYEERGDKLFTSFDALWNALVQIGRESSSGEKYLLIDALDECEPESQDMLLTQISQTFDSERNSNCGIHFLITSRPYPEIGRYLGEYSHKDLASYPKVARDLQMFINRRLGEISKKNRYPESVITEVSKILQEKAEGTFLWVGIACAELIPVRSRDVMKRLKALPQGLHSLYKNLLDTAFDNDEENESILQMLSFIATSRRALTVAELADACERYNDEDHESRIAFTREDIEMCRLMIVVENGIVRLLHKYVKDFLLSARDGTLLDELKVHATLASRCIHHLIADGTKDAFLNYAVLHWPDHAVLAKNTFRIPTEQEIFFELTSKERDHWLSLYRRMRIFSGIPEGFSVFHVAARWGIEEVARFALDCIGKRPDNHYYHDDEFRASNAGTPLQEAAK